MLDRLMVNHSLPRDVFTADYMPEQAITGYKLVNEVGQNLHVLFPPWHGGGWVYERLIKRLAAKGDAVQAYYFHDELLKPDMKQVQASYAYLRDTVADELTELTGSHSYNRVHLVAMSLGNPALSTVIGKFHNFDSVNLLCSATSIVPATWYGIRTQHIRAGIEASGYSLVDVEAAWHDIAPGNHLQDLVGKDVSILVSTTDKIIPAHYQMEFVEAVQAFGITPNVQTTRLGHYAAIGRYCLYGKI